MFLSPIIGFSQTGIDTVYSFSPGSGQNSGQGTEFYPQNIFGYPYRYATIDIPTNNPSDILSLGLGGEIIVGFKGRKLVNVEGPDFFIYENVFKNPATQKLFVEPALVSVSQDGNNFISFPFDSSNLIGCAGTLPTLGNDKDYDPFNYGGNAFDIEELGISQIRFIKITDITQMLINNPDHEFYDPILSGFDLDAVIGLNVVPDVQSVVNNKVKPYNIHIERNLIFINCTSWTKYILYDLLGNTLNSGEIVDSYLKIESSGIYFLLIQNGSNKFIEKIIIP